MKKLLIVAASAMAMVATAESLYIPASSDIHNNNYILKEGEIVYKTVDNTFTSLIVGNGTRRPYYVGDERALKCQNIYHSLDESVLVIEKSDNVTYENGTYLIVNSNSSGTNSDIVATFKITAPSGYILGNITYDTAFIDNAGRMGNIAQAKVSMAFKDNVALVTVTTEYATENKFWNFVAEVKNTNEDWENNTLKSGGDFTIIDSGYTTEGHSSASSGSSYRLSGLRSWVANLYNGDRGRHWSNYDAIHDVNMKNYVLRWGEDNNLVTGIRHDGDKLGFYFNGKRSMYLTESIEETNGTTVVSNDYSNADIRITALDVHSGASSNTTFITFTYADIPNVDLSKFEIKYATKLEGGGDWIFMHPTTITQTETTSSNATVVVTVPTATTLSDGKGFWAVMYDSTLTTVATDSGITVRRIYPQIVLDRSDLIVTSKIVLKSPGGKYFQLNVNDTGDLTTSAYTNKIDTVEK